MTKRTKQTPNLTVHTLSATLTDLAQRRESWEQNDFTKSNSTLYRLLGDCLEVYNALLADQKLRKALDSYLIQVGLGSNSHPSLQLRVVRAVFVRSGAATKHDARLHSYAKVIKVASNAGRKGPQMAKFISDNNGIDAIRRLPASGRKKPPTYTTQQLRELASERLSKATETLLTNVVLKDSLQLSSEQNFTVALIRKEEDGTGSIVFGINSTAAVNAMLLSAGKQLALEAEMKGKRDAVTHAQQQRQIGLMAFEDALTGA